MVLQLYKNTADPRRVDKNTGGWLTAVGSAYAELSPTVEFDIIKPVFILNYSSSLLDVNYAYSSTLGRYYFCQPVTATGGRIKLICVVDVLTGTGISDIDVIIRRSGSPASPTKVRDDLIPTAPEKYFEVFNFPRCPHINADGEVTSRTLIHTI